MIKIYYVRHGETDNNKNKILTGTTDVSLNETGFFQAENAAQQLKDIHFDYLFCSPLRRAKQTAKILNKPHNLQLIIDDRLIERDYGSFTGKNHNDIDRIISWNYYEDHLHYKEIEPVNKLFNRVYNFIDYLKENYQNKTLLIVAHSGVGRAFECYANSIPADGSLLGMGVSNATVNIYTF